MPSVLDDSDYPLIRLKTLGESSDDDLRERWAFLERNLLRAGAAAMVFDTTGGKPLSARHRRMWAEWLAAHDARIRKHLAGVAIVVGSAIARGVFTGVFWVWQPPMPYTFVANARDGEAWARARLASVRRVGEQRS